MEAQSSRSKSKPSITPTLDIDKTSVAVLVPPLGLPRTCHAYGLKFLTAYLAANTEIVDVVPTTCLARLTIYKCARASQTRSVRFFPCELKLLLQDRLDDGKRQPESGLIEFDSAAKREDVAYSISDDANMSIDWPEYLPDFATLGYPISLLYKV